MPETMDLSKLFPNAIGPLTQQRHIEENLATLIQSLQNPQEGNQAFYIGRAWSILTSQTSLQNKFGRFGALVLNVGSVLLPQAVSTYLATKPQDPWTMYGVGLGLQIVLTAANNIATDLSLSGLYNAGLETSRVKDDTKNTGLFLEYMTHLHKWVSEGNKDNAVKATRIYNQLPNEYKTATTYAQHVSLLVHHIPAQYDSKDMPNRPINPQEVIDQFTKEMTPEVFIEGVKEVVKGSLGGVLKVGEKVVNQEIKDRLTVPLMSAIKAELLGLVIKIDKLLKEENQATFNEEGQPTTETLQKKLETDDLGHVTIEKMKRQLIPPKTELIEKVDDIFEKVKNYFELPELPAFLQVEGRKLHRDYYLEKA